MMTQIDKLQPISRIQNTENTAAVKNTSDSMFGSIFQSAIDNVKQTDAEKNEVEYLLATGQLDNPAELTIASTKSQIAVELLVQLRNKALEAYNGLKNINA
ncbi:MAG: flagellar hook-basal body complex protein FliE [Oscillospiraceae bacterium]|nr:flagellar hook-basal body complex protein FliE [Oscillospiraceae bacterium]